MKRRGLLIGILVLVIVISLSYLCTVEAGKILRYPVNSWAEDQIADCALVLTGGTNRIREGFDLLSHRSVQKLIISGVNPGSELRDIFGLWPYYPEIRETDVILEKRSHSTFGNAQQSLPLIQALRCRDVILVTGRLHMSRALKTFQSEFPANIRLIPRTVISNSYEPTWYDLGLEILKSFFYSLWVY